MTNRVWIAVLACVSMALLCLLLLVHKPKAQLGGGETQINTSGTAHRVVPNTVVDISVGITSAERDLAATQRTLSQKSTSLMQYLHRMGAEHTITSSVSFSPDERYRRNGPDATVAYNGSMTISFRTTTEKAAEVLSGVLSNGANSIASTVFSPTEQDIAAARRDLAGEATKAAVMQADAMAQAAGLHRTSVVSINVGNGTAASVLHQNEYSDRMMKAAPSAMAAPPPPIQTAAGDQDFSVTVDVVTGASPQ